MFDELVKFISAINKSGTAVPLGTLRASAAEELAYEECEPFLPLRDGDVVFCPSCYDGDSFRLTWIDGLGCKSRIMGRLAGVDTPEMNGSSDKEKVLALRAKQRLSDVIAGEFVTIRTPGNEKYGRALCDLQTAKLASVSDYMLADPEICRPYDGGRKLSWD
ncbi:EsV-1-168 (Partial), partial [Ectocarpus siliculosus]